MLDQRSLPRLGTAAAVLAIALGGPSLAKEGTLVVVLPEAPVVMEACMGNNTANGRVTRINIYEPLTVVDPTSGKVGPRLATSWERLDDLTWRFHLRKGVTFHDGAPFNADAVLTEMKRTLNRNRNCHTEQQYFRGFKLTGNKVDDFTLDLKTDVPVPILPTFMSTLLIESPNEPLEAFTQRPIGTGPYKFDGTDPGSEIRLVKNPKWWGKPSNVEAVRYIWRGESVVRASMIEVGEADLTPDIAVQDATDKALDRPYVDAETLWLRIDTEVPPLNDLRVRQALNYAVDREAMRGTMVSKDAIPSTQPTVAGTLGHADAIDKQVFSYDPAKAKKLLAEAKAAGVPVDAEILLVGRTNILSNSTEMMEALMAMFEAVGFNMTLKMTEIGEWREYHNRPHPPGRQPVIVQTKHDNNRGDAAFSLEPKYSCKGTNSAMCDPEIDAAIAKATAESGDKRGPMMAAIFEKLYRDRVPDIYLFHMVTYARVGKRIDYKPNLLTGIEVRVEDINFK
jgi:peptide/nickel transport system substrate-binding protein